MLALIARDVQHLVEQIRVPSAPIPGRSPHTPANRPRGKGWNGGGADRPSLRCEDRREWFGIRVLSGRTSSPGLLHPV